MKVNLSRDGFGNRFLLIVYVCDFCCYDSLKFTSDLDYVVSVVCIHAAHGVEYFSLNVAGDMFLSTCLRVTAIVTKPQVK